MLVGFFMKVFNYKDKDWFEQEKSDKENFYTIKLNEKNKNLREEIKNPLIEVLIHYYINKDNIEYYLNNDEEFSELEQVINNYIPSYEAEKTRKGDFSEIISSEHLIQNYKYYFPYIKLQNKPNKNQSNQGEDIIGFIFSDIGEIKEIGVGEVKFKSKFTNGVFKTAHDQLKNSFTPRPKSLNMIVNYAVKNEDKHTKEFQKILSSKNFDKLKINNWIFCVTETAPKDLHVPHENKLLSNLTLVSVYLPEIVDFIHEIYDSSSGYYNEQNK